MRWSKPTTPTSATTPTTATTPMRKISQEVADTGAFMLVGFPVQAKEEDVRHYINRMVGLEKADLSFDVTKEGKGMFVSTTKHESAWLFTQAFALDPNPVFRGTDMGYRDGSTEENNRSYRISMKGATGKKRARTMLSTPKGGLLFLK
eukprot:TRINITY_DN17131_c0_g1_i1.p1 TRINITY_DN17131_c0_g1~~TRINITY_DN17131_c0_g1_i1.p1  ORF type:complete len:148 (+),score=22.81 TRINITY_DN17131_c0_g1_i1:758-1201(+)